MASSLLNSPALCGSSLTSRARSDYRDSFRSDYRHSFRKSYLQSSPFGFRCADGLLGRSAEPSKVSMAAEGGEASISVDSSAAEGEMPAPVGSGSKVIPPPRMCTLREFGEGAIAVDTDARVSSFFESLAANIEFSSNVQHWETLSGRIAMMVFASALLLEAITGSSVFEKMDAGRILEVCGAILASAVVAAGFAIALQAKTRVAYTVSKGYESLMNGLIDNVFDSLLFDREES